jgi:hypothetical protein
MQVKSLQSARGDLVSQISSAENTPVLSKATDSSAASSVYEPSPALKNCENSKQNSMPRCFEMKEEKELN